MKGNNACKAQEIFRDKMNVKLIHKMWLMI